MDINCERLTLTASRSSHNYSSVALSSVGYDNMTRLERQTAASCALRTRRRTAAAAAVAAQRAQNATDTGGGTHRIADPAAGGELCAATPNTTPQQLSAQRSAAATGEMALATYSSVSHPDTAQQQSVCIICRQHVEECCQRCCRSYMATTTTAAPAAAKPTNRNSVQSACGNDCCILSATPNRQLRGSHDFMVDDVGDVVRQAFNSTTIEAPMNGTTVAATSLALSSTTTTRLVNGAIIDVPASTTAAAASAAAAVTTMAVCYSCRRRQRQWPATTTIAEHLLEAPTALKASTMTLTTTAIDIELTTTTAARTVIAPQKSFETSQASSTLSSSSPSSLATTTKTTTTTTTLARTARTKFIEQHRNVLNAKTTTTTTTTTLPTPLAPIAPLATSLTTAALFERTLRSFQLLLLYIQVQFLRPIYTKINSFLYKNKSNNNSNSNNSNNTNKNKHATNSNNNNNSNRNSKNRNMKSNKRQHIQENPQPQQQQQRPPHLRLMQQIRCNSYYNNNYININNDNDNYTGLINSSNISNTSQKQQQQKQYANANANNNNNSCNNSSNLSSNNYWQLQHHIQHHTVQQQQQQQQQQQSEHHCNLISPITWSTSQQQKEKLQLRQQQQQQNHLNAGKFASLQQLQLQLQQQLQLLQKLRYFKMPNLTVLYKLLLVLSFLSLSLPSINAQATNEIAKFPGSAYNNRDSIRTSPVSLRSNETVCRSLDIRNSPSELSQLRNCTVIEGFLLITLMNQHTTQEFTQTFPLLTEVTEFIIVYRVHNLRSLSQIFPNLSIIRGTTLFEGYALIVYYNPHLEDLGLSKLTTITRGGVRLENNIVLCYVETIAWKRIVNKDAEIAIENNSKLIECPKCPGDARAVREEGADNEPICKEFDGQIRCWNSKKCQKICPDRCKDNCVDEHTCCDENCLGGCSPDNVKECISCRDYAIYNNTCIEKCPPNYFSYLDRRCLTADECIAIGTKFENNRPRIIVPYDGKCSTRCPNGYNKIGSTCQACGDNCVNKCDGALIDSVERAKDFTGCTHIVKNGLTISIKRGGKHLMEELETGLASIQEISTFLKIQGTYGLTSLSFFKHLKRINGTELSENKFAIYALENNDLESVWGDNRTVEIERGRVFFHFNPKLCYNEIEKLLPMMKENATFDKNEVAIDSNGHKGSCNTELLNVTVLRISSRVAVVEILNPLVFDDNRTFIGYQYYFMEDKYKNATKYSQRICDDGWTVSDPTKDPQYIFINLLPYTQYAYYVKTWTISSEKRNAQSNIHYFKTKSAQPKFVQSLNAYAISSSKIAITWTPPSNPQGNLTTYRVRAVLDKRSQVLEGRDYCKDPAQIDKDDDTKDPTRDNPAGATEAPNAANCKCDGEKSPNHSEVDTSEATIVAGIDFENTLQNFIYVKHTKAKKKVPASNKEAKRRRRSEGEPQDSFLVRHMRAVPDNFENKILKTTTESDNGREGTIITTVSPVETTTALGHTNTTHNNSKGLDPTGQYYESFILNVSISTTRYEFTQLKHFSYYTIGVEACRAPELGATEKECSDVRMSFVRTKKMEGVDKVQNLRVGLMQTNTSRSEVRINWDPPENPNGDVVSYTISYKKSEQDAVEEKRCITEVNYRNLTNGYTMPLPTGNYSIRVRANSLAGDGVYSEIVYIDIPPEKWSGALIAGICIAIICIILLMGGVYWYVRRKYAPPNDIKIIPTVNPYYISLQYVQDGWEVERDRVIQLSSLGQGSFGMVYEGILKGLDSSAEDTPCAIKTVNENATDRERINFLSEASVMKQFDTYHVVRLLGVCSIGQPALVVMELMKYGDLKSYLRAHRPDSVQGDEMPFRYRDTGEQPPPLSRVFQMAIEIADGMTYLSAKKFVHRDLAARNCMVGEGLTVKIGDFGMTRDVYETDYYRKGDKGLLPVRWMPPESLRDGIYATSSDVFSYGVVLWEIVTLASQPYPGYSNDQVLRFVIEGGVMERPDNCPDKIYEIMQQCWEHRPSKRPSFFKIIRTLLDHVNTDSGGYISHFREVSYFFSNEGTQENEKDQAESMHTSDDIFSEENEIDDATTPLRTDEFNEYKLNMANNSSVEQEGDSPLAADDEHPHSPFSHSLGSANVVSSTPDGQSKNSYNFSQMSQNNQTLLSSLPSTSAGIVSGGSHSQSHQLHQPGMHLRQPRQSQFPTGDTAANYVLPDYDPHTTYDSKNVRKSTMASGSAETDERGYEMYDPSPNYREHAPYDPTVDEDDFDGMPGLTGHSTRIGSGGQQLLPRSKPRHRMPVIMPMSSSMPDEIIGTPISSSLHPSTASAASSNASSTNASTSRYAGLKAVADKMRLKNINRRIFNHKRSGSNASHKSTSSNPNTATSSSSNSNLAAGVNAGRGKSISGHNLGTIESGGSGSASSYVLPRFFTPTTEADRTLTRDNPNYRLLDETANTSCLSGASGGASTKNTSYRRLNESLNSTLTPSKAASTSTAPASNISALPPTRPYTQSTQNANYTLMGPTATEPTLRTTDNPNYVVMNQPAALSMPPRQMPATTSTSLSTIAQIHDDPAYTVMGPLPRNPSNNASSTSTIGDDHKAEAEAEAEDEAEYEDDDNDEEDDDDDGEPTEHIKMELLGAHRRGSDKAQQQQQQQQQRKSRGARSRSQSQNKQDEKAAATKKSSSTGASPSGGLTSTSEASSSYISLTPIVAIASTTPATATTTTQSRPSATYSLKENWLRQQSQQTQHQQQPPPPNGFIGRDT